MAAHLSSSVILRKEWDWPPVTCAAFDVQTCATGALLIGSPEEVAQKIARHSKVLDRISRVAFQMNRADLPYAQLMQSIELVGAQVAPALREFPPEECWQH
jgi:alkanesulfonate monooxygenase SsuD/methylene tetrahydromethanopterin reductase-like flavin-dependent oxidoreductase (luciferase family)